MKTLILRLLAILFSLISPWFEAEAVSPSTKLRVAIEDSDNRPYVYLQDGKCQGYYIELVDAVAKKIGWEVVCLPTAWKQIYNMLYNDKADAANFLMRTPLRPEPNIIFDDDNILNYFEISVYARSDSPKIDLSRKAFSRLARYQIGVIPDVITDRWFSIVYPEVVLNRSPHDAHQLMQMLESGRFDFAIAIDYSFDAAVARNPKLKNTIHKLLPPLAQAPAYLAFQNSERGRKMSAEFGTALKSFKGSKEFKALKTKYKMP